ncbi:MAG: N-acetylmuramoyl-L-alanine amidase [Lachnospiraceae bacterium]|nr:N-acetylmuramoyl-L-alanine amidase [Lachnospiraceae bacterium]
MSKIIAIDAGHGKYTAGKRCLKSIDPVQTREWILNDRIADRLQELLAGYDCKVIRVDDTTGRKDISLSARVNTANNAKADVYISIHHNAGVNGGTGGGTVVYYYSSNIQRTLQARALYNRIVEKTGLNGNRSEPVQKYGFYVIKKTRMPAFLVENGFMDSKMDTPIILTAEHAEKTAQGILTFLVEHFTLDPKGFFTEPAEQQNGMYYPAYTGKKTTLSAALASLGINSTYVFRKQIAAVNNITGYRGAAVQNTQMYNLLVAGLLKKK